MPQKKREPTVSIAFRIHRSLHNHLGRIAKLENRSRAGVIREWIARDLQAQKKTGKGR